MRLLKVTDLYGISVGRGTHAKQKVSKPIQQTIISTCNINLLVVQQNKWSNALLFLPYLPANDSYCSIIVKTCAILCCDLTRK